MTPEQSLNILYQAARMASLPAADHEKLVEAAKTLQEVLAPKAKTEKTK